MNEIPLLIIQIVSALIVVAGSLTIAGTLLAISNWAVGWLFEAIIYAVNLEKVLKEFSVYYRNQTKKNKKIDIN